MKPIFQILQKCLRRKWKRKEKRFMLIIKAQFHLLKLNSMCPTLPPLRMTVGRRTEPQNNNESRACFVRISRARAERQRGERVDSRVSCLVFSPLLDRPVDHAGRRGISRPPCDCTTLRRRRRATRGRHASCEVTSTSWPCCSSIESFPGPCTTRRSSAPTVDMLWKKK